MHPLIKPFLALSDFEAAGYRFTKGNIYEMNAESVEVATLLDMQAIQETEYTEGVENRGVSVAEKVGAQEEEQTTLPAENVSNDQDSRATDDSKNVEEGIGEMTFGKKAAGVQFNPSGDQKVLEIKKLYAQIIDLLNDTVTGPGSFTVEQKKNFQTAITEAKIAKMCAVEALTWKEE